jgi:hypothetical protein
MQARDFVPPEASDVCANACPKARRSSGALRGLAPDDARSHQWRHPAGGGRLSRRTTRSQTQNTTLSRSPSLASHGPERWPPMRRNAGLAWAEYPRTIDSGQGERYAKDTRTVSTADAVILDAVAGGDANMIRFLSSCLGTLASVILAFSAQAADCPPTGWSNEKLEALRTSKFAITDQGERQGFAEAVVACTASPDPFLRDQIAFEALSHMLREGQIGPEARIRIARDLLARLRGTDTQGFARPFAALVLAESVRADKIEAHLPAALRRDIADAAITYVATANDYRGFDEREGWRHAVAHGADLLMQIANNPNFKDRAQLDRLRDAVGAQIAPASHFYIYGEPERLMRPIVILSQRGLFTQAEWDAWFEKLGRPAPLASWDDAFQSQAGLAKRHNLRAFLYAAWTNSRLSENKEDDVLLPGTESLLRNVP